MPHFYNSSRNLIQSYLEKDHPNRLHQRPQETLKNYKVYKDVLDAIGSVPLIRLNKIPQKHGVAAQIFVKCEYLEPAGSLKDPVALAMYQDASNNNVVTNSTHLIEASSGNTGIAVALVAAVKGLKCSIVSNDRESEDKFSTIRLLGANLHLCRAGLPASDPNSSTAVTRRIRQEDENALLLDQFENPANPLCHYTDPAFEILEALDNKVDMLVGGSGTGGTLTGFGTRFKEINKHCKVVLAEPEGSILFNHNKKGHPYLVEGIGSSTGKVPINLDQGILDDTIYVTDKDSFNMARDLARFEGLLCGGSSGTALVAAIRAAKKYNLPADKNIVLVFTDGIRNYMDKFVKDQWMEALFFKDTPQHEFSWWEKPITELTAQPAVLVKRTQSCQDALKAMDDANTDIAIVVDELNALVGAVSKDGFRTKSTNPGVEKFEMKNRVDTVLLIDVYKYATKSDATPAPPVATVGRLSRTLDLSPFVVFGEEVTGLDDKKTRFIPNGIVKADAVLAFILAHSN